MAAIMLREPIIAIESEQGEALAKSLVELSEHYGLTASKSVLLWINFAGTSAMIYGPKIYAIAQRHKKPPTQTQARSAAEAAGFAPVVNFSGM